MDIQGKIYEELQEVKEQTTTNNSELKQINTHLAELNSQTRKNTDAINSLQNKAHEAGDCGLVNEVEADLKKIDKFIEHWPKLQKIIYILLGLLFLQIPWVSNYIEEIFESVGLMRYFF